jgi:tetratricopeptide (TPR) repeat protein
VKPKRTMIARSHGCLIQQRYATTGGTLEQLQQYEQAEIEYRHALELKPDFTEARFNLGLLLLAAGRYTEGWTYYEARSKAFGEDERLPFPQWNGEDLSGKTLLLLPEQGYGDTIQFVRYVPLLKARGAAKISVICAPYSRHFCVRWKASMHW